MDGTAQTAEAPPGDVTSVFSIVVPKSLADGLTELARSRGQKRATLARTILLRGYERERRIETLDDEGS